MAKPSLSSLIQCRYRMKSLNVPPSTSFVDAVLHELHDIQQHAKHRKRQRAQAISGESCVTSLDLTDNL